MTTLPMPDPPKEYDHPSGWPPIEHPKDLQHGRTFAFKHVGAKSKQNKKKSQRCNMQRKWTWCSVLIFILLDYLWNISTCPTFESWTIPESISCITSGSSSNMRGCVAFWFLLPNFSGFFIFDLHNIFTSCILYLINWRMSTSTLTTHKRHQATHSANVRDFVVNHWAMTIEEPWWRCRSFSQSIGVSQTKGRHLIVFIWFHLDLYILV